MKKKEVILLIEGDEEYKHIFLSCKTPLANMGQLTRAIVGILTLAGQGKISENTKEDTFQNILQKFEIAPSLFKSVVRDHTQYANAMQVIHTPIGDLQVEGETEGIKLKAHKKVVSLSSGEEIKEEDSLEREKAILVILTVPDDE